MKWISLRSLVALVLMWGGGCGNDGSAETDASPVNPPYYFLAVHNEPSHYPNGEQTIARNYQTLERMVAQADGYGIKLTLMFPAQWADYIVASETRQAQVAGWAAAGHEIAAHHHSIYHGNWDGYTDYSPEDAKAQREALNRPPEPYLGTLADFTARLRLINLDLRSGCVNDETDKQVMPDAIVFDTCSGLANHGEPGRREGDADTAQKGVNEYITVATYAGIERRWLAHYQLVSEKNVQAAQAAFAQMSGGAYGGVMHSNEADAAHLAAFMEYLHHQDPRALGSRTVAAIIEGGLLEEKRVSAELLDVDVMLPQAETPCGDGECDSLERANPDLCPNDCV